MFAYKQRGQNTPNDISHNQASDLYTLKVGTLYTLILYTLTLYTLILYTLKVFEHCNLGSNVFNVFF